MPITRQTLTDSPPDLPLYQQVYFHLRGAILAGELPPRWKLPSSRALAAELGVARNTVQNAYLQLIAEGYLESAPGSGTFVAGLLPDALLTAAALAPDPTQDASPAAPGPDEAAPPRLSGAAVRQIALAQSAADWPLHGRAAPRPFRTDTPALDAFPYELWSQLASRLARRVSRRDFPYQGSAGDLALRKAITAHASLARRVRCTPDQVLIVPGSQGALDLAARLLLDPGDGVWMEDPGYLGARGAFLGVAAQVIPVPVDQEGLVVAAGIARAPQARLVYTTPSHQFPFGATLSLRRRLALLEWARNARAYILEDDYDSEFRYTGRPLASLQGLDEAGRVIYIGTFSKVLYPALRIGYLIVPPALVEPFLAVRRFVDIHPPMLEQAVLAEWITRGHFASHLRRMRKLYAERRSAFLEAAAELPLEIQAAPAGLHCAAWLPGGVDAATLAARAATQGLELTPLSGYYLEPPERQGLLLGFGGFTAKEIRAGVRRLAGLLPGGSG